MNIYMFIYLSMFMPTLYSFHFVTSCDVEHFSWIMPLIDTINKNHPLENTSIFIYDLGLSSEQIQKLKSISNVSIKSVNMINPHLLKKFVVRPNGRLARGWYSWKPVIMHQALQELPYFLYMDCGMRVKKNMKTLFDIIQRDGYLFVDCAHTINPMTTNRVRHLFNLNAKERKYILDKPGLSAGFQGICKKIESSYLDPIFNLAHDIYYFEDDGTAPWGFGGGRHDQTLFSIQAHLLGYKIHNRIEPLIFYDPQSNITSFFAFKSMSENPLASHYHLT